MDLMSLQKSSTEKLGARSQVVPIRSQAEIIAERRRARRARINLADSRARSILNGTADIPASITIRDPKNEFDLYREDINKAISEIAAIKE
ncbi:hypothetical protein [Metabacillus endolithicus]|nr:hypothetical protein [Metabacillus endolithicus]UPG66182.1 hypothetical protein MVE64_26090 [Metabacillus endolithicus]